MQPFSYKAVQIISISNPVKGVNSVSDVVSKGLDVVLPISGMLFVAMFVYAGITYVTSAGDAGKVKSAQAMMSNAAIGFAIIAAAFVIRAIVEKALGLK